MIEVLNAAFPDLSIRRLCAILGVSRSGVYERRARPTTDDGGADVALRDAIERLVRAFPGDGYRRVTKALQRAGWVVNHKRVLRVLREESLLCRLEQGFTMATTDSRHTERAYPNLLAGLALTGMDQAWVADITSIRLPTEFIYLACILDAYSRRVVGWELSRRIDTALTLAALERALATRRPALGLIHHSDSDNERAGSPRRSWLSRRRSARMLVLECVHAA